MHRKIILLILLLFFSFLLFLFHNFISILIAIFFAIGGIELSSDAIFSEEMYGIENNYSYSFLVLGTITSLDEIMVTAVSVVGGFPMVSIGALVGSTAITIFMYLILSLSMGKTLRFIHPIYYSIIPFVFFLLVLFPGFNMKIIPVYALALILSLIVIILVVSNSLRHQRISGKIRIVLNRRDLFLIPLALFSLILAYGTDKLSSIAEISQFSAGFIIPGLLGTIPEISMIRQSLIKNVSGSAEGTMTGSSIIKGTALFPLIGISFGYSFGYGNPELIGSLLISLLAIFLSMTLDFKP